MLVNEDDIEAYHRDGFVVLRGVVPDEVLASLKRGVDTNMSSPSAWSNDYAGPCGGGVGAVDASDDQRGRRGRFFDDYVNWGRISEYRRAALSGPLPRIAADLMGSRRPRFYHEHVLVKEPGGTASQTPWHQDDPYYGVDSDVNVSLWVPLDPVPDVVSLRILTGSHAHGRPRFAPHRFVNDVPYVSDDAPPPGYEHLADHASLWSDPRVAICPANPGDVVAFHFRTLHAAPERESGGGADSRVRTPPTLALLRLSRVQHAQGHIEASDPVQVHRSPLLHLQRDLPRQHFGAAQGPRQGLRHVVNVNVDGGGQRTFNATTNQRTAERRRRQRGGGAKRDGGRRWTGRGQGRSTA